MRLVFVCSAVGILLLTNLLSSCTSGIKPTPSHLQLTVDSLLTQVSSQSTQIANHLEFISYLATRQPPVRPTPNLSPVPTPFVTGSLFINDGKCCLAAIAGQPIIITVVFQAVSPAAEVIEMRSRAGLISFSESDLSNTNWEPFSPRKVYEYIPPLNWSGFFVTVQYRDALGNLSPVYSSRVSVEGQPTGPMTPTP